MCVEIYVYTHEVCTSDQIIKSCLHVLTYGRSLQL